MIFTCPVLSYFWPAFLWIAVIYKWISLASIQQLPFYVSQLNLTDWLSDWLLMFAGNGLWLACWVCYDDSSCCSVCILHSLGHRHGLCSYLSIYSKIFYICRGCRQVYNDIRAKRTEQQKGGVHCSADLLANCTLSKDELLAWSSSILSVCLCICHVCILAKWCKKGQGYY